MNSYAASYHLVRDRPKESLQSRRTPVLTPVLSRVRRVPCVRARALPCTAVR